MKMVTAHWVNTLIAIIMCGSITGVCNAQQSKNYALSFHFTDKDSSFKPQELKLTASFYSEIEAFNYINKLPSVLTAKGYPVASIDSFWIIETVIHVNVYLGKKYNWLKLSTAGIEKRALEAAGYRENNFTNKVLNLQQLENLQQRILNFYERQGYPFASVFLDSVHIIEDKIEGSLSVNKSVLYKIDSIRVIGKVKINNKFLQHYLLIPNGSVYNKDKLSDIDKRILELPFLTAIQPSDLTMLGSGAVLNLYVKPKKSSQVNFIVGVLPAANNSGKLQLTGDVNLDLRNLLGGGEQILLKWQQLQPKSPRLNIGFNQPYLFNSAFGADFLFDLFKKDSSFLQVNAQLGLQYLLSSNKTGKIFVQWQSMTLLSGGIDTNQIIAQKKLPPNIDVSSTNIGLNYEWIKTNYKYNPKKGNEINLVTSIGIKRIKKNNDIVSIKDPSFNYGQLYDSIKTRNYQLRIKLKAAHYFSLGKFSVLKAALNSGVYVSPAIFRNELFQIGGYNVMRGFDEESIYATRYGVGTLEYRNIFDLNSYLSFFVDYGIATNKYQQVNVQNNFIGAGVGLVYEAKLGIINISYAIGKRNDVRFNFREASKIHFGYVNYF
ncbi:MAG: BamA/TamA family outer membrane protein [Bacteroidetes bacterium]|nr:BamA/TamA family outer membrane protein [Bacteroidota bacterium]